MNGLADYIDDEALKGISARIVAGGRITPPEGLLLYERAGLPLLGMLAGRVRRRFNGKSAFFNRNFHIEPTNLCIHNCLFCSYHKSAGDPGSWDYGHDEILEALRRFDEKEVTEVHITGGVHPSHGLDFYCKMVRMIKQHRPSLHVKAFSAIEIDHMISREGLTMEEGLRRLADNGVDSIPGGGAEIFDEDLREKICPGKTSSERWLEIHEIAHNLGIKSNATMLYGHIESYSHRIDHMERLRKLQDRTSGFNAFIPLRFRNANNCMEHLGEVSVTEDLRNYAVARLFLDNIPHIKAYWPMTGREVAQLALSFGADDLDGTIGDTTKIYSMAGAGDRNPVISVEEITRLISEAGYQAVERDSAYNPV
ncbi:MAG: aminofutalosine synthase MqnE [Bacteroidales bacterium]